MLPRRLAAQSRIDLLDPTTGVLLPAAPPGAVLASSVDAGWTGITVELHRMGPTEMPEHIVQGHPLLIHIGRPIEFEWWAGGGWRRTTLNPGGFCLQTHGEPNLPRWRHDFEFLAVALDPAFVAQLFNRTLDSSAMLFREQRGAQDLAVSRMGERFATELRQPRYGGALYGESVALAFSLHLLGRYGRVRQRATAPRGKLAGATLGRVVDYIHEHLAENLSLNELAHAAGLSLFHFSRLFRASTGLSPHNFILRLRVERAIRLLRERSDIHSLSEIALESGFYDHAHFTHAFRRLVGTTPSDFAT